jgi:hypothetical protein
MMTNITMTSLIWRRIMEASTGCGMLLGNCLCFLKALLTCDALFDARRHCCCSSGSEHHPPRYIALGCRPVQAARNSREIMVQGSSFDVWEDGLMPTVCMRRCVAAVLIRCVEI